MHHSASAAPRKAAAPRNIYAASCADIRLIAPPQSVRPCGRRRPSTRWRRRWTGPTWLRSDLAADLAA